jgi:cystathionine gamma-synthase
MSKLSPESWLVKAARPEDPGASLNVPMVPSSNFLKGAGIQYSREDSTATWNALETIVGELEGGECTAFSSGMAAAAAVFAPLPVGSNIAVADDCYHGVTKLTSEGEAQGRWSVRKVAVDDLAGWKQALLECDLVWLESPSNPMLILADLQAICSAPRKPGCLLGIDNTVATPLNQQPLSLGADVSMHSGTKYIGGHSDLLMGLLVTGSTELASRFRHNRLLHGATPGVMEAYLATRGLRTLAIRLERAQANAQGIAGFLEAHPAVKKVRYPGLASHPQHELAKKQMKGFSGLITFEVKDGAEAANRLCDSTRLISHATSLGSVESTMERRSAQPGQEHLPAGLMRLSVGIEQFEDLQADLEQALRRVDL